MIEVRRDLYMDEANGMKVPGFSRVKNGVARVLNAMAKASCS